MVAAETAFVPVAVDVELVADDEQTTDAGRLVTPFAAHI